MLRREVRGPLAATGALGAATVALASLAHLTADGSAAVASSASAEGVVGTAGALTGRVAADWLAVFALLVVAGRSATPSRSVTRRTVGALTLAVFFGGVAFEAWPLVESFGGGTTLGSAAFLRGVMAAVGGALFPTALFLGVVAGGTAVRETAVPDGGAATPADFSLGSQLNGSEPSGADSGRFVPAAGRTLVPLGVVAAFSLGLSVTTRLALGADYPAFVVADAAIVALTGLVTYGTLAVALVVAVTVSLDGRRVAAGTVGVWVGLFFGALVVAVLGGVLGALLVTHTAAPMAVVERSTLAYWPSPLSGTTALGTATFLAGAVGLAALRGARPATPAPAVDSGDGSGSPDGTRDGDPRAATEQREPSATDASESGEVR